MANDGFNPTQLDQLETIIVKTVEKTVSRTVEQVVKRTVKGIVVSAIEEVTEPHFRAIQDTFHEQDAKIDELRKSNVELRKSHATTQRAVITTQNHVVELKQIVSEVAATTERIEQNQRVSQHRLDQHDGRIDKLEKAVFTNQ